MCQLLNLHTGNVRRGLRGCEDACFGCMRMEIFRTYQIVSVAWLRRYPGEGGTKKAYTKNLGDSTFENSEDVLWLVDI